MSGTRNSNNLSAVVGEPFIITEGCEARHNAVFLYSGSKFTRGNSTDVGSNSEGSSLRDYKFTPNVPGEFSIAYEVTQLSLNGELVRRTTYNIKVKDKEL